MSDTPAIEPALLEESPALAAAIDTALEAQRLEHRAELWPVVRRAFVGGLELAGVGVVAFVGLAVYLWWVRRPRRGAVARRLEYERELEAAQATADAELVRRLDAAREKELRLVEPAP